MNWLQKSIRYSSTKLSKHVQDIYQVIKFIGNIMQNLGVELTTGGKGLAEAKIQSGIF